MGGGDQKTRENLQNPLRPGSLKSQEQKPRGVGVWCRTAQSTLGSMRRDAVSVDKRKPGAGVPGKHGVWKALELLRGRINKPEKDYFSFLPLVHCVLPLDSG